MNRPNSLINKGMRHRLTPTQLGVTEVSKEFHLAPIAVRCIGVSVGLELTGVTIVAKKVTTPHSVPTDNKVQQLSPPTPIPYKQYADTFKFSLKNNSHHNRGQLMLLTRDTWKVEL
ncbi:uncharacterized protein LOC131019801 [Salvia miltiorrhiza]|uniref:uncharacterized protein LOC131019801 n=1 Tax=Salvia miltiorrhiza TaxID=226208 RepID=UPI0025AC9332|nr:uncharacterized protein LOC131019801 [Salvia miltiorrhiza]